MYMCCAVMGPELGLSVSVIIPLRYGTTIPKEKQQKIHSVEGRYYWGFATSLNNAPEILIKMVNFVFTLP